MTLNFLDKQFREIFKPAKPAYKIEEERRNAKYYQRLKRLCKKQNITYKRDLSYWDFSEPIGTIGLNDNVEDYQSAWYYVKNFYEMSKTERIKFKKEQIDNDPHYGGPTVEQLIKDGLL